MRLLRTIVLVLPLLAGGCHSAGHPAARLGPDNAVDMRFPRASPRSVTVHLWRPAYATFVQVTPGRDTVAEWVDGAAPRELRPGRHLVALQDEAATRRRGREWTACNRPGEQPFYDASVAATVASRADIRQVRSRGRLLYCARTSSATLTDARSGRHLLVIVAPRTVDADALQRALDAFNAGHGGSPQQGETLARSLAKTVAGQWPGSTAYYLHIPLPR